MHSGATLNSPQVTAAPSRPPVPPLVFVDGMPRTDLAAVDIERRGPLDERRAELIVDSHAPSLDPSHAVWLRQLAGCYVAIVSPVALDGGTSRLRVEVSGRIDRIDDDMFSVVDDWSAQLDAPNPAIGRSASTLANLFASDGPFASISLSTELLAPAVTCAATPPSVFSAATVRSALDNLCETFGLTVDREAHWVGSGTSETRYLRSIGRARRLSLALPNEANPVGSVAQFAADTRPDRPTKFIARADPAIVESTFMLIPGWGDAYENLSDDEYDRAVSSDFQAVANVFRLWVLNEDGSFDGDASDVGALFEVHGPFPSVPMRLRPSLTQDGNGRSVGVVIERSIDAGLSWSTVTGRVEVLNDRAGVYLDDDTLDAAWLDAVRSGDARIRVTASLAHPLPLESVRWRGNPLHGSFAEHVIDLGETFAYRAVDTASRFREQIDTGQRTADVIDERSAMAQWLALRAAEAPPPRGSVRIVLHGIDRAMSIGDRIDDVVAASGEHLPGDLRDATLIVTRIRHRLDRAATELEGEVRAAQ